jgi:hypothetical protein
LKSLIKLAIFLILLLVPFMSHGTQDSNLSVTLAQSSSIPVLNVGDTWHYHYSGPEQDSTELILRNDNCGSAQCVVDQETNPAWNDTVWLTEDWNLSREYYVDHTTSYNSSTLFTPALQQYPFPLQTGKSWWWNSTATGWYKDQSGNHTDTGKFSILRKVINETTVTVPAGTFDTFLVARYVKNGTLLNQYRWFSTQVKTSVRWEILDTNTGAFIDSYAMTSYSLAAPLVPFRPRIPLLRLTHPPPILIPRFWD